MDQAPGRIRIILVDGSSLFRQAIGGALGRVEGLEVVAESQTVSRGIGSR